MADSIIAHAVAAVIVDRWYHFECRIYTDDGNANYRIKLRYNTESADELDSGSIKGRAVWDWYSYCFKSDYTDPDFRILLSVIGEDDEILFDNVVFKEVLLEGAVDFSYEYSETDRSSNWIRLNPQGVISPIVSANDFKFKLRATDYRAAGFNLDYLNVRWKLVDKRGVRGPYAG
jgi:hypothetical protein